MESGNTKVLHLSGGGDIGGAKSHILSLLAALGRQIPVRLISLRDSNFARDAEAVGIETRIIQTHFMPTDLAKLVRMIRRGRYGIVHAHGSKANMMMVLARLFIRFIPVTTVHSDYRLDYLHSRIRRYTFGVINRIALAFISNYMAVSGNFKTMLVERGFPPSRIHVVYNGMDFSRAYSVLSREAFLEKYRIGASDNDKLVGIVARLHPVKGVEIFVRAAAEILKVRPHVRFIICGDGDQRSALQSLVRALGIGDRVHFLGHITDPWEALQHFDINVLSSHSESFPYAILEGAYYSLPTVSSRVGGIADLIEHGVTGCLFPPGDYQALARLILDLAGNPDTAARMGQALYKRARDLFSLESMCRTQLLVYQHLMESDRILRQTCKEYDMVLSGYYGFRNSGDDAILLAIVRNLLENDPGLNLTVLSANPRETRLEYNVDSINRYNLFSVFRVFRRSRLFVYGGGNLLQDDTSTRSLFYYLAMTWLARVTGLKVMFYAAGIGPIYRPSNKVITARVVNQVDLITLRENMSGQELADMGIIRPRIEVTADPVLALKPEIPARIDTLMEREHLSPEERYIGISLRYWKGFDTYSAAIAAMADHARTAYGLIPVFIPMQHPDDLLWVEKTAARMKTPALILKNKYPVPELLGFISRMEVVVGMRLHTLIYAANRRIPMIGLAYEPKIHAFLQLIGLPEYAASDIQHLSAGEMTSLLDRLMACRKEICAGLQQVIPALAEKASLSAVMAIGLLGDRDIPPNDKSGSDHGSVRKKGKGNPI